jgi:hypothetical protein
MISPDRLLGVVSPLASVFPDYYHDVADINEALDHGVANCAVRAYAGGLLLRDAYPNPDLYVIQFGIAPEHGTAHIGLNGVYTRMGHAAVRFHVPGNQPVVLESYADSMLEAVAPSEEHERQTLMGLDEGYRNYLDRAGLDDVEVEPSEVLRVLLKRIGRAKS